MSHHRGRRGRPLLSGSVTPHYPGARSSPRHPGPRHLAPRPRFRVPTGEAPPRSHKQRAGRVLPRQKALGAVPQSAVPGPPRSCETAHTPIPLPPRAGPGLSHPREQLRPELQPMAIPAPPAPRQDPQAGPGAGAYSAPTASTRGFEGRRGPQGPPPPPAPGLTGQHLLLRRPQQQGPRPPATSSAAASFSAAATNRPSAPPTDTTAGAGAAAAATSGRRGRWRGPPALRRGPGRADSGRSEPRGQATGTPEAAPGSAGPRTRSPRFVIVDSGPSSAEHAGKRAGEGRPPPLCADPEVCVRRKSASCREGRAPLRLSPLPGRTVCSSSCDPGDSAGRPVAVLAAVRMRLPQGELDLRFCDERA